MKAGTPSQELRLFVFNTKAKQTSLKLLHLFNCDGIRLADLYAAFTAQTLIGIYRVGLVINHLDEFFERIPAKLLILPGLVDLFVNEGLDAERTRQMTHLAASINAFTLRHNLVTLISTRLESKHPKYPPVGKTLSSSAQVHIHVDETPMRTIYSLMKHPSLPNRNESLVRRGSTFGVTLPLDYFFGDDSST